MSKEVLEADFHGHTCEGSWPEGVRHTKEDVVIRAKEVGLDILGITEHDTVVGVDEALKLGEKYSLIVMPGVEITAIVYRPRLWFKRFPFRVHIGGLGITPEGIAKAGPLPFLRSPEEAIDWIEIADGVPVANHPENKHKRAGLKAEEIRRLKKLKAIEVMTIYGLSQEMVDLTQELGLALLANTDYHTLGMVGLLRTIINKKCRDYRDVTQAILERRTEPKPFMPELIPDYLKNGRDFLTVAKQLLGYKI